MLLKNKIIFSLLFSLCFTQLSYSQNKNIDSLSNLIEELKKGTSFSNDTTRLNSMNLLSRELISTGAYHQADSLARKALSEVENLRSSADKNSEKIFKTIIYKSLTNIAIIYSSRGDHHLALENFLTALKIAEELGDKTSVAKTSGNIGNVYKDLVNYSKALEYYYRAIQMAEELKNDKLLSINLANIGNVYKSQLEFEKALEFYYKALKLAEQLNDKKGIAADLSNIGVVYKTQGNYPKALEYYLKALKIAEELNYKLVITNTLGNIGGVYSIQKEYHKALEYFQKALSMAESLGDKNGIARMHGNIGTVYAHLDKNKEAEEYLLKAITKAREIDDLYTLKDWHNVLSQLYGKQKRWELSLEHYKKFIAARDSIFNEENTKNAVRLEMNFEYKRKTTADSVKNAEEQKVKDAAIMAQQAQLKQERSQRYSLYGGLLLVLVFSGFLFNRFKITSRQKAVIEHQKVLVEEKNKEMMDSINYAKKIQDALLKEEDHNISGLPEHFIYFKPKDIVSGDFYWGSKKNNHWYLCVADCTGHGVPGAFMSMLGISYLNEIITTDKILSPAEILDRLREKIVSDLKQKGESGESKDGMDISMIRLNLETNELQWAGANNPLWICHYNESIINEIKPDKQPIGYTINPQPFKNNEFILSKGDLIYLFTDGFADQFGGKKGKKFKYKSLKELMIQNSNLHLPNQKEKLEIAFNDWKGKLDQVDDICVLGIRL